MVLHRLLAAQDLLQVVVATVVRLLLQLVLQVEMILFQEVEVILLLLLGHPRVI